ncbi:tyrosine-type recombinase/integrase [Reinekea marinisedimentorum]|uniref:Integrase n=1 Tax=Reinekea marinisedimentorum TaxID=230495 RepID=A0A4R3I3K9_9GAMM|nr:tyrosine-type recombinase/integrase [Reinekea marinisedimentorum]TCS40414.1 integrase [Reinekea marinisedimentorum]
MDYQLPRGISQRNGILYLSFSVQGERYRESLGLPATKPNIKHAELRLQSIKYEISVGTFDYLKHFPNSRKAEKFRRNSGCSLLVADLLNDWLKRAKDHCAYSTLKGYASVINFHLIPRFGALTIDELTSLMVSDWLSDLKVSGKRKRNILIPLRQALSEAMHDGLIDRNPLLTIKSPKHKTREPKPFNKQEVRALLSAMEGVGRNFYWFAFETGLRTSELIGLRWEDVFIESKYIYVSRACVSGRIKETKTSSGTRNVPLSESALECLADQKEHATNEDGFVFFDPKSNKRWKTDQFPRKRIWKPAVEKAGVEYRNPYQTRHTYASKLLSKGENPLKVAHYMGHSDWGMIRKVYGRWIVDR